MKFLFIAALTISAALGCGSEPPSTALPAAVAAEPAPAPPGDDLLTLAHRCVADLFPDKTGVAGQPLRFDAMAFNPYQSRFAAAGPLYELPEPRSTTWHVRIEEEHPHRQVPHGAEFLLDTARGTCTRAPMD